MDEFTRFNKDSPKIMEDVINSNHPKQEEYLSRLLNEQDFVQNLITTYDLFATKQLKFQELRRKLLGLLLHEEKHQTPGSVIHEVPEHLENVISASVRKEQEQEIKSKSDILKATNLDIANQRNKKNSFQNLSREEINDSLKNKPKEDVSTRLRLENLDQNNENKHKGKEEMSARLESLEKNNESNQFMKEAEEQFEQEVSMSQFKKVNLSQNNEKESFSGKMPPDHEEIDLNEKPKKGGFLKEEKKGEFDKKMIRILDSLEKVKEERNSNILKKIDNEGNDNDVLQHTIKDFEKQNEALKEENNRKNLEIESIFYIFYYF